MTFDERLDRLAQSIEATDRQIAANSEQISKNSELITQSSQLIATCSQQIVDQGHRIDGLIRIAESHQEDLRVLLEVTARQVESTRSLEQQWQAYLNTLPRH